VVGACANAAVQKSAIRVRLKMIFFILWLSSYLGTHETMVK
jgi:hypothetical protein